MKKLTLTKKVVPVAIIFLLLLAVSLVLLIPNAQQAFAADNFNLEVDGNFEQRVRSTATLADDFEDDSVIVVLSGQATREFREYTIYDFPEVDIVSVNDLTGAIVGYAQMQIIGRSDLMQAEAQMFGGQSVQRVQSEGMMTDVEAFRRILQLQLREPCKENVLRSIRALERREDVLSAEPNFRILPPNREPNDPGFTNRNFAPTDHWALRNMSLPGAWAFGTGRAGVVVGVVDTGINFIGDLANRRDPRADVHRHFMSGLLWNRSGVVEEPFDVWNGHHPEHGNRTGHGTQTASIIGAAGNTGAGMTGINWDVRMVSLRIYDNNGGSTAALIRAINYAASINIPILYLGFQGQSASSSNQNSIRSALNSYTGLAISAAGNWGRDVDNSDTPTFPASIRTSRHISVGAIDRNGNRFNWSNVGRQSVHLFAYGTQVLSINANGAFQGFSGTSSAGPLVTGIAALLQSVHDNVTAYEIRDAILNNVDDLPNVNGLSVTDGRPNAHRAMAAVAFRTSNVAGGIRIDGLRSGFNFPANANIVIPASINGQPVVAIGASAFANQTQLSQISIPASVTHIAPNAFDNAVALEYIHIAPQNPHFSSIDGVVFNHTQTHLLFYPWGSRRAHYTVPNGVTCVGLSFRGNQGIQRITFPRPAPQLLPEAFKGSSVTNINLTGVTHIPDYAFAFTPNLTTFTNSSSSLQHVGVRAFANSAIRNFSFGPNLQSIGIGAFENATELRSATSILGSTTIIPARAFYNTALTSIVLPGHLTTIGSQAFARTNLTNINFPATLTSIGADAFANANLVRVALPASLLTISARAFSNNPLLSEVVVGRRSSDGRTALGVGAFNGTALNQNTSRIIVPSVACVTSYRVAANWSAFSSRIQIAPPPPPIPPIPPSDYDGAVIRINTEGAPVYATPQMPVTTTAQSVQFLEPGLNGTITVVSPDPNARLVIDLIVTVTGGHTILLNIAILRDGQSTQMGNMGNVNWRLAISTTSGSSYIGLIIQRD